MVITVLVCLIAALLVLSLIGLPFVVWSLVGLTMQCVERHLAPNFLTHGLDSYAPALDTETQSALGNRTRS